MPNTTVDFNSEIKSLLIGTLSDENLNNYHIELVGTTEKGEGLSGDIYFINLTSKYKNYNIAMKCSKSSEALRKTVPTRFSYENEIYMYNTVFPAFRKFELERNMNETFDTVPKYYGHSISQGQEVIVLENLKPQGYELWDKKIPLPGNYIETVLKQYGKWHAISAAMHDQTPEEFDKLANNLHDVWLMYTNAIDFTMVSISALEHSEEIWANDMDKNILNEWKTLKEHADFYVKNLRKKSKSLNVITHGDCWNNNFIFKATDNNDIEVVLLDWQLAGCSSPVIDISYFLYSCISGEDLEDFDDLLKTYYSSFAQHLRKLGSDPDQIYPYSSLLDDWKIYAKQALLLATTIFRVFGSDEKPDMEQLAEKGESVGKTFCTFVNNVDYVKERSKGLIQHAVKRDFVKPIENLLQFT